MLRPATEVVSDGEQSEEGDGTEDGGGGAPSGEPVGPRAPDDGRRDTDEGGADVYDIKTRPADRDLMPDEITPPESREQAAEKHRDELEPEDRVRPELAESLRCPPERRHLLRSPRRLSHHPVVALPREDRDHRARERRESADRFRACRPRTASNQDDREDPDHRDCRGPREHRPSHEGPSSYRERHRGRRLAREPQRGAEREATRQRHQGVIAHAVDAPPRT